MEVVEAHVDFWDLHPVTHHNPFLQPAVHPYLMPPGHAHGGYLFIDCLRIRVNFTNQSSIQFGSGQNNPAKRRRIN